MADITANTVDTGASNFFLRFLNKIWDGLVYIGESSARARALRELSEMSDEDLAKLGLTREDVIKRVFSDGLYI